MKRINQVISTLGLLALPALSLAASTGLAPAEGALNVLLAWLTGPVGVSLATLGVAGTGVACVYGYLEWTRFIQTIIGMSIVFGSSAIVSAIQSGVGS